MTQQLGSNASIMIGFEAVAYKTVAVDGFVMPLNTFGVKGTQALNMAQTLTGTRNPVAPFLGNRDVRGQIVVPVDSLAMWYWMKAAFGAPTTTGSYTHEFKIGSTQPSFSIENAFLDLATDKYQRFLGCKVSGFSITLGGDGELVMTINVIGASDSMETSAFDGTPTTVTLGRVNNFQAALLEGGSSIANVTELSINVDFGLDDSLYVIGSSGVRGNLTEGIVGVSGNIKTLFEDDTLLAKAIAGTESSLKATVTGSASSVFELEIQELQYERSSIPIEGPKGLLVDLNFQGFYSNGGEASALVARITNAVEHAGGV